RMLERGAVPGTGGDEPVVVLEVEDRIADADRRVAAAGVALVRVDVQVVEARRIGGTRGARDGEREREDQSAATPPSAVASRSRAGRLHQTCVRQCDAS